jgi:serine/threonine protein kinase/Flp pilus assembly protein TadD
MSANRARAIFIELVAQVPPEQWEGRLAELAGEDQELRAKVAALLAAHRKADSFLEEPAVPLPVTGDLGPAAAVQEGPSTTIGPYKLLERIGEGGMGTVWMAEQREPVRRQVALKILKAGMDTRQVVARFEAERQALALMDHPNIARVFDGGTSASGRPYFVMELVQGRPITTFCDEHRLTPSERLELLAQVCLALQHAHQKGIIHRDVKPSNVLVARHDGRPVVKVIDFGVAKAVGRRLTEGTLFTGCGAVVGTLEYMSPEQAELNNQDIDTRSDIYALGVLLYELLTGTTPLSRQRLKQAAFTEVLRLIREEEPPRPSARLSESKETLPAIAAQRHMEPVRLVKLVRGELDWIVMKALEKDRNRRYESANGLAHDIENYLHDEPVQACPPSPMYRFRKFARRNKARLAVAGLALFFLIVLGGGVGWVLRDREARQAEIAKQATESLTRARKWLRENKLTLARQELAEAKGRMGNDLAALGSLAEEVETLAAKLDNFASFLDLIDQAHQEVALAEQPARPGKATPGKGPAPQPSSDSLQRVAKTASFRLQALSRYQVMERDDWLATLEGGLLGPDQVAQVRRVVYEELLVLADDLVRRQQDHRSGQKIPPQQAGRESLAYLRKAETAFRPTAAFYRIRARCRKALGEEEAARADEELFRQTPATIALDHYLLGMVAVAVQDKAEAVKQFEAALRVEPTHYWSLLRLGMCLTYFGQHEQDFAAAAAAFTGCLMQRPGDAMVYCRRAYAYGKLRRYEEALADHAKAIELDPREAQYWNNRGATFARLDQADKALADFSRAVELNPKYVLAWTNRGAAHFKLGQSDKALTDFSRAVELDPKDALAWSNRGVAHFNLGQPDKALADFSRALELDPKDAKSWSDRGAAQVNLGQLDKALADFSRALELDPMDATAWINRGVASLRLGQPDKAAGDFRTAIRLKPLSKPDVLLAQSNLAIALNNWAWALATNPDPKLRDPARAVELAREAVALKPKEALYCQTLAWALYRAGDCKAAVMAMQKVKELGSPGDSKESFVLAMAYWQLGNKAQARKCYDQAVQWMEDHQPKNEELRRFRAEAEELMKKK